MIIIGLVGRCRSGKTSTATYLKSYASSLAYKTEVFEMSSYILADFNKYGSALYTRETIDPRLLVERGMKRRTENPYYWIDLLEQDIKERNPDIAIIPNIRFTNESRFVKGFPKGILVRIKRFIKDNIEFISYDRDPNHESEIEQLGINCDLSISNYNSKPEFLKYQAKSLLDYLIHEN